MASFSVRRLGYALGAEVTGIDLSKPLDADTTRRVRDVWLEYSVLCFPGQNLEPAELMAFGRQFGVLDDNKGAPATSRHPEIEEVLLLANTAITVNGKPAGKTVPANRWHADHTYTPVIPTATVLLAKDLPEIGGDTMFANMHMAYEALSPGFQAMMERLSLVHDITLGPTFLTKSLAEKEEALRKHPTTAHPAVKTHPETGRKSLLLGDQRVRNVEGMTEEESKPLIDFLHRHSTRYEFVYRHRWTVGDLIMWDNRAVMHYAVQDFDQSQLRRMIRCAVMPEVSDVSHEPLAGVAG